VARYDVSGRVALITGGARGIGLATGAALVRRGAVVALVDVAADEVAQAVFVRAWRGLARFEERSQFSTWLYRIAFNEAQRRLSRRPPKRAEPEPDREDPIVSLSEAPELGPEAQTLDREFERTLERALEQLPADWRSAVVLRDVEGLSTHDAAEIAGVREAAFKSRLHRGRMQLRTLLEPYLKLEEG